MSIDDPEKLRFSAVIGTIWNVVLGWGAVFIGLLGRIMVPAVGSLPDKDPEMIYLVLSSDYFGPVLYGLIIGGIFAAILSTADSQLLVVSSTFVRDVYEKIIKKGLSGARNGVLAGSFCLGRAGSFLWDCPDLYSLLEED
jgi:Na+/proline symporter